uniref:glutathione transferase n=1 Tax=Syphacia muris TaxID=451379 RepID=A0A0N5B0A5_9BILA
MHNYKLTYFDFRWFGEGARLLFHYAGVPFEDERIQVDQWPALKPKMPFGQLPVLTVDGKVIAQSGAICRYLAREFDLVPKNPVDDALVDSIYDAHKDFLLQSKPYFMVVTGFTKGDKEKLFKGVLLPARDLYFPCINNYLSMSDSIHLIDKQLSWVDIVIADNLCDIEEIVPTIFDGYPELKKFADKIHSIPQLQKYLKERPAVKYPKIDEQ